MAANKKITELTTLPDSGGAVFIETVRDGANFKLLCNLQATAAPTVTNDSSQGYSVGSIWNYEGAVYVLKDASVGAADWVAVGGAPKYKVYTALLSQSGTSAPVATVLENTLGVTPVWSRNAIGSYLITSTGLFENDKTWVSAIDGGDTPGLQFYISEFESVDYVVLIQHDYISGLKSDGVLRGFIEIRVYP